MGCRMFHTIWLKPHLEGRNEKKKIKEKKKEEEKDISKIQNTVESIVLSL